jgi:DNA-binding MarR family transcriptional regulator
MTEPGLTLSRQAAVSGDATVTLDDRPPSELWDDLAADLVEPFVDAVRDVLADTHAGERPLVLADLMGDNDLMYHHDITRLYASVWSSLADAVDSDTHQEARALFEAIGQEGAAPTLATDASLDHVRTAVVPVIVASAVTPTVTVRLEPAFQERRADHRRRVCGLLAALSAACDVRVCGGPITLGWFVETHHDDLPVEFSSWVQACRGDTTPVDDLVDAAREALTLDGRGVSLLRDLAGAPDETAANADLVNAVDVTAGRVSQLLSELEALQLVERYGQRNAKRVRLLPAGFAFLDALDAERGRQTELDSQFSESRQSNPKRREPRRQARGRGGEDAPDRDRSGSPYTTEYLDWPEVHAAASVVTPGGITTVEERIDRTADRARWVSYDEDRDEAIVAIRATTPLQYVTSLALALASPGFFDQALPVTRLEDVDDSPAILRDARCVGCINEDTRDDPKELRDALVKWGKKIGEMTTDLQAGECDDRDRFRGEIMRSAHGLAGSIVHLLDAAGVDLVRELRLPRYHTHDDLAEIAETVSIATAIQSQYGACSVYRELYETREQKRQIAITPDVDATDPYGELIGSLVIRGPQANRLARHVEGTLPDVLPLHENSGEIAVRVPVSTPDRTAHANVLARILALKNLEKTREAVTLFRALVPSVYDTAEAVYRLGSEGCLARGLRLDEIRYAIGTLDASQILPNMPRTVSRVVAVLLQSTSPLPRAALVEAADVSTRSLQRHLETLETFDLVRYVDGGYRFALPFNDSEADERGAWILPHSVDNDSAAAQDLLYELVETFVDDPRRFGDASDPVCGVFLEYPYDWGRLRAALPAVDPWVRVAKALCDDPDPEPTAVEFGASIEQTPLHATPDGAGGVAG